MVFVFRDPHHHVDPSDVVVIGDHDDVATLRLLQFSGIERLLFDGQRRRLRAVIATGKNIDHGSDGQAEDDAKQNLGASTHFSLLGFGSLLPVAQNFLRVIF